jgi:hypothetical protein
MKPFPKHRSFGKGPVRLFNYRGSFKTSVLKEQPLQKAVL